ncbi:MAG: hypothetical protein MHM6MM_004301 [Cercozoa sp. M6MM]
MSGLVHPPKVDSAIPSFSELWNSAYNGFCFGMLQTAVSYVFAVRQVCQAVAHAQDASRAA